MEKVSFFQITQYQYDQSKYSDPLISICWICQYDVHKVPKEFLHSNPLSVRGYTERILARWRRPVALREAMDPLYWSVLAVSCAGA